MQIIELMREGQYFTGEARTKRQTYLFMTDLAGRVISVCYEFKTPDPTHRGWCYFRNPHKRPRGLCEAVATAIKDGRVKSMCRPGSVAAKKLRCGSKH